MTKTSAEAVFRYLAGVGASPNTADATPEAAVSVSEESLAEVGASPEEVGAREDLLFDDAGAELETLVAAEGEDDVANDDAALSAAVESSVREP
jgi:hypothetical protein